MFTSFPTIIRCLGLLFAGLLLRSLEGSGFSQSLDRSANHFSNVRDQNTWIRPFSWQHIANSPDRSIQISISDQSAVDHSWNDSAEWIQEFDHRSFDERVVSPNILQRSELSSNGVSIPEPMVFDLVRPLGARRGELEINTLAIFPWRAVNRDLDRDPFGSGQTTRDLRGIEWAPEIEYAFADGWAVEFELPFEKSTLEAYKFALQGTFGTAFDNQFIHGFQVITEPTTRWKDWNSTMLYLAGIRFDEQWSALLMLGARMNLSGPDNDQTFERLINGTMFYNLRNNLVLGLEGNHAVGNLGRSQTLLVPQLHYELTEHWELQSGIGLGVFDSGSEQSFIMRLIYAR